MNKENVIKGLETIKQFFGYGLPSTAEMFDSYYCILNDAIVLLKEQEAKIEQLNRFVNGFSRNAVPVVRCKDCENNNQCSIQFKFANADNPGDWYCADGKRKLQKAVTGVKLNPDGTWTAITKDDYDPIWD